MGQDLIIGARWEEEKKNEENIAASFVPIGVVYPPVQRHYSLNVTRTIDASIFTS